MKKQGFKHKRNFHIMKKGQMSSVFGYIFAFIVGAMLFAFFVWFAYSYMGFAGKMNDAELVVVIDDDLTAFSVLSSAEKYLDYNMELDLAISEGRVISNGVSKNTDKAIFSELYLNGDALGVETRQLNLPFSIMNLFYIDDGSTLYVVVYDAGTKEVVEDLDLPDMMNAVEVGSSDLSMGELSLLAYEYDKVRFVFFTNNVYSSDIASTFTNYDVLEVSSSDEYEFGEVEFDGESVTYMGYPMLLGAIFSEDVDSYNYNFDVVVDKMGVVTDVYYEKSRLVSANKPLCEYSGVSMALNSFKAALGGDISWQEYKNKVENLEELNNNLGGDCPEIF